MVPKVRMGSGWQGLGLNLRKTLKPASLTSQEPLHRIQSAPKAAVVVADEHQNHGGARNNGKEKVKVFQNLKSSIPTMIKARIILGRMRHSLGRISYLILMSLPKESC